MALKCDLKHTLDPWTRVKGSKHILLKLLVMHVKLMGMEERVPRKHKFCPYTYPRSLRGGQKVIFFPKSSHTAYQIKGNVT